MNKLRTALLFSAILLIGCSASKSPAPTELNCLWTVVAENREQPLDSVSRPAPGCPMVLRVASQSQAGVVLVATYEGSKLVQDPPPVLGKIPASGENSLAYTTPDGKQAAKVFTAFFAEGAPEVAELEQLLAQVGQQKDGTGPAAQRLYSRLSDWKGEDRTGSASAGQKMVELGASISVSALSPEASQGPPPAPRMQSKADHKNPGTHANAPVEVIPLRDWQKFSQSIQVSPKRHPVLIYNFEPKGH